jgi:hypothetical protein
LWHPQLSQLERKVITELYPSESALRKIEWNPTVVDLSWYDS